MQLLKFLRPYEQQLNLHLRNLHFYLCMLFSPLLYDLAFETIRIFQFLANLKFLPHHKFRYTLADLLCKPLHYILLLNRMQFLHLYYMDVHRKVRTMNHLSSFDLFHKFHQILVLSFHHDLRKQKNLLIFPLFEQLF